MSMLAPPPRPSGAEPAGPIAEIKGSSAPGVAALVAGIVMYLVAILIWVFVRGDAAGPLSFLAAVFVVAGQLALSGLVTVVVGEARVIQLFGRYHSTVRAPGLRWVNPFTKKRRVSVRIRNLETAQAKVNDADGNPIEIAAVVVWQVRDTAQALYAVDDYPAFVATQAETAVRHVASAHPYAGYREGELSLRDNAAEITDELTAEIAERVRPAGVTVIESRLTRLSYAPEIAQAMLRQQQAGAVIGARQTIVAGAVGIVEHALQQLKEQDVVDLAGERRAAMASNLLVVLCSERATKPVVNIGSLYH
jgi:regulator of protease activity HflC (stomatin/prohibitin superfamily)